MIFNTGWWWTRRYMTSPHSIAFLRCWVLHSIFLSTMYLVHYSLMAGRFMVSVLILLSFSRFIWPLVSFSPIQHTHETSRPVWLQAAESAYRFTLGSIAGGEWHVCCRAPGPPRGNLSRPDWHAEAPGPAIVLQGERLWYEASALCCRATSGSRLSLESELWNDTNLPEPHSLESPCNYTGRSGYKEHLT